MIGAVIGGYYMVIGAAVIDIYMILFEAAVGGIYIVLIGAAVIGNIWFMVEIICISTWYN